MNCDSGFVVFVLLTCLVKTSISCNGYYLKVNSIKSCGKNDVIQMNDFDMILDKDCNVIPKGCVTITKPFKKADLHYTFSKPPMPNITGDEDLCKLVKEQKTTSNILSSFALPNNCPVKASKHCAKGDKKYNIGKYKSHLPMIAGNMNTRLEAKHDTGSSCIQVNMELAKRKSS